MKKYAIVVAGGLGQRMGADTPKQFLLLKGKPILYYTLQTFLETFADLQVILVLPAAHLQKGLEIIKQLQAEKRCEVVTGGETRFHSVKNGLGLVRDTSVVFVHDGVRSLVSRELISNCYKQAVEKGSAIPVVAVTDSIRIADQSAHQPIDRNKVRIVQTPQTFQSEILLRAFEQNYCAAFTDEATVVEASGREVFLIEGEYNNLKITRPIDLCIAEKLLEGTAIV